MRKLHMISIQYVTIFFIFCIPYINGQTKKVNKDEYFRKCGKNAKIDEDDGTRFIFKNLNSRNGPGVWPWLVSIGQIPGANDWTHRCGGSLLSPYHVITAAHCPLRVSAEIRQGHIYIRAGDSNLKNSRDDAGVQIVRVVNFTTHPDYKFDTRYSDVGVLVLENPVELTEVTRTICLPAKPTLKETEVHRSVAVTGWGYRETDQVQVGSALHDAHVQVYPEAYCNETHIGQRRYENAVPFGFTNDLFCGGDASGSEGTCDGDSGSPAVFFDALNKRYLLLGIVSGGLTCGTQDHPNIYVRVTEAKILNWINLQISESPSTVIRPISREIDQIDKSCPVHETCKTRRTCSSIRTLYGVILKSDPEDRRNLVDHLKSKVCNRKKKAFCCPTATWNTASPPRCGRRLVNHARISLGLDAAPGEWPWNAALMFKERNGQLKVDPLCVGSLVSSRVVLTAAHCLSNPKYKLDAVRLGDNNITSLFDCEDPGSACYCPQCQHKTGPECFRAGNCAPPHQVYKVEKVVLHPQYRTEPTLRKLQINDLALVFLEKDVELSNYVQPVCLPGIHFREETLRTKLGLITGWGLINYEAGTNRFDRADVPKTIRVSLITREECADNFNITHVPLESICHRVTNVFEDKVKVCKGDSGGALVYSVDGENFMQYGVVSAGIGLCDDKYPGFAAALTQSAVQWITDTIGPENLPRNP